MRETHQPDPRRLVDRDGAEQAAVVVEITARTLAETTADQFAERVRDVVWDRCQLPVAEVAVVRRGALARASSGKTQRTENRRLLETGGLDGDRFWLACAPDGTSRCRAHLMRGQSLRQVRSDRWCG
ncbi:hypothetical protein [Streptomyces sp. WAC05858]|uniref:hypothetical protein n=1 Tax=Streptomyces TaxID=1883 RepID=UPI000F7ABABC|nr:hypothetical protein [Streptomyces sp. WAC05858]RSS46467.1 hypothetical protein EF902_11885 [Streptomyces sp. WAC05858]